MTDSPKKPGLFILAGVVAFVVVFNIIPAYGQTAETQWLITGVYILGIATLFLLAYFLEHESVLFRWLVWVSEHGRVDREHQESAERVRDRGCL